MEFSQLQPSIIQCHRYHLVARSFEDVSRKTPVITEHSSCGEQQQETCSQQEVSWRAECLVWSLLGFSSSPVEAHPRDSSGALHSCRAPGFVCLGLQWVGRTLQAVLEVADTQQFCLADVPSGLPWQTSGWTLGHGAFFFFCSDKAPV